jgi:hypothetical protein
MSVSFFSFSPLSFSFILGCASVSPEVVCDQVLIQCALDEWDVSNQGKENHQGNNSQVVIISSPVQMALAIDRGSCIRVLCNNVCA